jgi:hypothetical protein
MHKINVMFAIEDLELGGAERIVAALARGLDRSWFSVHVACLRKAGALAEKARSLGIERRVHLTGLRRDVRVLLDATAILSSTCAATTRTAAASCSAEARCSPQST